MEMGKPMELKLLVMVVVAHVASAFFSKTIAGQKARSSKNWFWAGLIFGPLGLIAAVGLAVAIRSSICAIWLKPRAMSRATSAAAKPRKIRTKRSQRWRVDGFVLPQLRQWERAVVDAAVGQDNLVVDDEGVKAQAQAKRG